jgi:uncharacterized membrane protein
MAASLTTHPIGTAANLPSHLASPFPLQVPSRFGSESRHPDSGESSLRWLLKKNCSITPRQLMGVYVALSVLSLGIGAGFWLHGATLVLPFTGVELLALAIAMAFHARHAADAEEIRLGRHTLSVVCRRGGRVERMEFQPAWVRVEPERGDRSLIEMSGEGRRIAVGRFVRPELRRQLADELRWALRRWSPAAVGVAP